MQMPETGIRVYPTADFRQRASNLFMLERLICRISTRIGPSCGEFSSCRP
jgi:hypothetical protein